MTGNVIPFPVESAEVSQRKYFATLNELQREFPEVAWGRVETLLTSYGEFCIAFPTKADAQVYWRGYNNTLSQLKAEFPETNWHRVSLLLDAHAALCLGLAKAAA